MDITKHSTISDILKDFGNEMQEDLKAALIADGSYISGDLANHINFEATVLGTTFYFQLRLKDYYDYVNKGVSGTQKFVAGSPYQFIYENPSKKHQKALADFGNAKLGITDPKDRKRFGYLAARKQKKFGMKGNSFYDDVVTKDRLDKLRKDLAVAAGKDALNIISHTAKKTLTGLGI
tara:strand:+ start:73 stop:606 length:534 start_codon:yes stop_codon:yes gene_type:complete